MGARILVTSLLVDPQDHELLAPLHALGGELLFHPFRQPRPPGEMARLLRGVDAVIASSDHITAADLEQAHQLRIIARTGVGYDAIDLDAARKRDIIVTIT
ncbi:MAG: hydroxyacid dehydrogenase, partial [Chloroflexi bacterium]|nr:hydroxyacid dehydrogenase [Chloroflexota bacterium]